MNSLKAAQDLPDTGYFRANITSQVDSKPIEGATIRISDINNPEDVLEEITTDASGQSETVALGAPPVEYSMVPESSQEMSSSTKQLQDYYKEQMTQSFAEQSTESGGLGIAQMLYEQMKRNYGLE